MKKKGLLFTLGLLFLTSTVFSLSIVMFHDMQNIEKIVIDASALDRLHDVYSSIENSLKDIFEEESGIDITISYHEDYIFLEENLSNSKAATFKSTMDGFKTFVEANFEEATLNIDGIKNTMPLLIKPHDINYTHNNGYGTSKKIEVTPASLGSFNTYTIYVYSHTVNVTGITWEDFTSGSKTLEIVAEDSEGSYFTDQRDVESVDARVSLLTGGPINIDMASDGKLEITNTADSEVLVRTRIGLPVSTTRELKVTYPEEIISLDYADFDMSKKGRVTLS